MKDRVDTCRAHAYSDTDLDTVDDIELDIVLSHEFLHLARKMLADLLI